MGITIIFSLLKLINKRHGLCFETFFCFLFERKYCGGKNNKFKVRLSISSNVWTICWISTSTSESFTIDFSFTRYFRHMLVTPIQLLFFLIFFLHFSIDALIIRSIFANLFFSAKKKCVQAFQFNVSKCRRAKQKIPKCNAM